MGLIRKLSKDNFDLHTRKLLYCSLVRPQLECVSEVWSPNTIKYMLQIESVQCRATKFILGYLKEKNYNQRLISLSILPLEYRREIAELILLLKSKLGQSDIIHSKSFQ